MHTCMYIWIIAHTRVYSETTLPAIGTPNTCLYVCINMYTSQFTLVYYVYTCISYHCAHAGELKDDPTNSLHNKWEEMEKRNANDIETEGRNSQKSARYEIYHVRWLLSWLLRISTRDHLAHAYATTGQGKYTPKRTRTRTHTHAYTHMHTYILSFLSRAHAYTHAHTCTHTLTHTHTHTYTHTHTHCLSHTGVRESRRG